MSNTNYDIQGRFLGIPYDFRRPSFSKLFRRIYRPGGPMFVPKVFGAGWTLNVANRGTKVLLAAMACFVAVAVLAS